MSTQDVIKAEATSTTIFFEYEGETFGVPKPNLWPLDAIEAFEDGKVMNFMRALFGAEDYERIKAVCKTMEGVTAFMTVAMQAAGHDPKDLDI